MREFVVRWSELRWLVVMVVSWLLPLLLVPMAEAACAKGTHNDLRCSGHGSCSTLNQCVCDPRYFGYDCSQARCPSGPAWVAPARATDSSHYPVECSNKGICDRMTGRCVCDEGFTGSACQRMTCPNSCSSAGECISIKALSRLYAVASEPIYDSVWDADMIYGCKCRPEYHSPDCSKHTCPYGDDPMTTGQVNEIQVLRCSAKAGFFHVYFLGEGTTIRFDATESDVKQALENIIHSAVKVTFSSGTKVCNDAVVNAVSVEFLYRFGPQPAIKVFNGLNGQVVLTGGDVFAASGGVVLAGKMSVVGTKEWTPCSNRGYCVESTGLCSCYLAPMPGYRSSDGYGNVGVRGDCGAANKDNKYGGPIKACVGELACSGHGFCSNAPNFKCTCETGWGNGDCASRTCPKGPSWFTIPSSANTVHNQFTVCSDAGHCDTTTGECQCFAPFTGDACDIMNCPGSPVCHGHGQCISIRQLSFENPVDDVSLRFDYGTDPNNMATFDRDSIYGCKCDPGYEGYDCSLMTCPFGDDPDTTGQVDEVQLFQCIATTGVFQLQFRTVTSAIIPFDTTAANLRTILLNSLPIEDLEVVYSRGNTAPACSSSTDANKNVIKLTFLLNFGNLPPLQPIYTPGMLALNVAPFVASVVVAQDGATLGGFTSVMGTKENAVCSRHGICNSATGACICASGYGSSDGRGKVGKRDDCGYLMGYVHGA